MRSKTGEDLGVQRGPGQPRKSPEDRLMFFSKFRASKPTRDWYARLPSGQRSAVARGAVRALTLLSDNEFATLVEWQEESYAEEGLAGCISDAIISALETHRRRQFRDGDDAPALF